MTATRRRQTLRESHAAAAAASQKDGAAMTPKIINAGPSLEKAELYGIDDQRPAYLKLVGIAGRIFIETIPQWLAAGAMLGLIFGGCCSNVFALEAIIKVEPASGTLLTFVQFLYVAVTGYVSQIDTMRPPFFLTPNRVPIRRWLINIVLFFSINVLNNHAFSYDISVPVHIILRSGGSITTMIAGTLWGKRFTRTQVTAVLLLTVGVITAAWSDSQSKARSNIIHRAVGEARSNIIHRAVGDETADHIQSTASEKSHEPASSFSMGLVILFVAQVLSAIMGLYTEETYKKYGSHWKENMFYSHLLSLPLFLPFSRSLVSQFVRLANSPPLSLPVFVEQMSLPNVADSVRDSLMQIYIPSQLVYLSLNVLTQYACIRGVNMLASASSALTVTIVLNIRKLVSLLLSIWLFENKLSSGTIIGACIVFGSGALYSTSKSPAAKHHKTAAGGTKAG